MESFKEWYEKQTKQYYIIELERYFRAVNNPSDPYFVTDDDILEFNENYEHDELSTFFEELNVQLSKDEITKAIKQLKSNRSAGPDFYINEFFVHGITVLLSVLHVLFNKIFDIGYFPKSWSEGYIIPLHKKGSKSNVENYRGITLLSTLGILFTRVLNNRLSLWAEEYNVYVEAQMGFRSGLGTVDGIYVLHNIITHILNSGKKLYCAFVDFTKAFDYVVRDNLWHTLVKLGLKGRI